MSVPETMPDRQHRRGTLRLGVHRQAAASGRAASGTRNRCLQRTVRDAVGDRVDQQRFEEPPGTGATARAWSGKRVSCDLAQQFPACDFRPENALVLISHFANSLCIML